MRGVSISEVSDVEKRSSAAGTDVVTSLPGEPLIFIFGQFFLFIFVFCLFL